MVRFDICNNFQIINFFNIIRLVEEHDIKVDKNYDLQQQNNHSLTILQIWSNETVAEYDTGHVSCFQYAQKSNNAASTKVENHQMVVGNSLVFNQLFVCAKSALMLYKSCMSSQAIGQRQDNEISQQEYSAVGTQQLQEPPCQ